MNITDALQQLINW